MIEAPLAEYDASRRHREVTRPRPAWSTSGVFQQLGLWGPALVAFALVGLAWQFYASGHVYVLPEPSAVLGELAARPGFYLENMLVTLQESVVGAGCGMAVAFVLAVAMAHSRTVRRAVMPLAIVLNVTPMIAVAPGLVVAFGFGLTPKYIVTAVIVFFPFLVNALMGLRAVDPLALEVMRTMDASRAEILWRLRLPSSLPFLFAGARVCLPLSVIGAVAAEFVAAGQARGLGTLIVVSATVSDLPTIYAAVVTLSLMGLVLSGVVLLAERKLLSWHTATAENG